MIPGKDMNMPLRVSVEVGIRSVDNISVAYP